MTKLLTDPGGFLSFQLAHSELCRVGESLNSQGSAGRYTRSVYYDVVSGENTPFRSSSCPMEWAQGNAKR